MSQLWKSKLNGGLHPVLFKMNQSTGFDMRLAIYDVQGSLAHVKMLANAGLIGDDAAIKLTGGLKEIALDLQNGSLNPEECDEDVHGFIERVLVERLGESASNIHIARSRNEQVLLDTTLFLRTETEKVVAGLRQACAALRKHESAAGDAIMPSYTHLRRAQPMFVKQMWAAHRHLWEGALSEFEHVLLQINKTCPMGAGASNGTTLPTFPDSEALSLGFEYSPDNSLSTLSSRKNLLLFAATSVHWLLDVSRLMEDLINWSTTEFGFVSFDSSVTTGSSMMPQKRNPDICELLRGKSAVAMGHYIGLMTLLKGLPMGYMKDLQEDKPQLFAIADIVSEALEALPILLDGVYLNFEKLDRAASDPLLLATDVMEWLVLSGTPLRIAHREVADCVYLSTESGEGFDVCAKRKWPSMPAEVLSAVASCRKRSREMLGQDVRSIS